MSHSSLAGRTALVTGVTSGIGHAITAQLLGAGARVLGVGRDPAKLAQVAAEWTGGHFEPVVADLSVPEACQRAAEVGVEAKVDILVNNAGFCVYTNPTALPMTRWREMLEVNLLAAVALTSAIGPHMSHGGHIVNVSSVTARHVAHPRFGPYAVTKAALESFTGSLRLELARRGVAVSMIAPGLVDTPLYQEVAGFEREEEKLRAVLPEWLDADDVADAVLWMLTRPGRVVISELTITPRGQAR
jgi:NADP-dependent 3-hydroxy acid dehydrogenase YdfG